MSVINRPPLSVLADESSASESEHWQSSPIARGHGARHEVAAQCERTLGQQYLGSEESSQADRVSQTQAAGTVLSLRQISMFMSLVLVKVLCNTYLSR